jgi:hypothetical protein
VNLNNLKLEFHLSQIINSSIDNSLETIGNNLLKLKYLFIKYRFIEYLNVAQQLYHQNRDPIKGDLFPTFAQFKNIEYLKICHTSKDNRFGRIESLKSCRNLKYLSIKSNRDFTDEEIEEYKFHFSD